jgi:hypothetical protein
LLEHPELLAQGKDLKAEVIAGTEEDAETGKESKGKWNYGSAFMV